MLATKEWRIPAVVLFSLISVWLLLPVGREAYLVLIFHLAGLAAILLFRGKVGDFVRSENRKKASFGLFLAAYCGNISRHLFGNILSVTILGVPAIIFIAAIPYTLVEQLVFALGATIIGNALLKLRHL
jgi:hypothetical protein